MVSYCVMLRMTLNIKDSHANSGNRLKKKFLLGFSMMLIMTIIITIIIIYNEQYDCL